MMLFASQLFSSWYDADSNVVTSIATGDLRYMFQRVVPGPRAPVPRVYVKDVSPGGGVRRREVQLAVEPARATQSRVHRVEAIRCAYYYHFSPVNKNLITECTAYWVPRNN